jgi:Tol biopolymer transport system component
MKHVTSLFCLLLLGLLPVGAAERLAIFHLDQEQQNKVTLIAEQLTAELTYCGSPSWTKDGQKLFFDATPGMAFGKSRVHLVHTVAGQLQLADLGPGNCPSSSPDGKQLAFHLNAGAVTGASAGVWLMHSDGTNRRKLDEDLFGIPKWSPDGRRILVTTFSSPCQLTVVDGVEGAAKPVAKTVKLAGGEFFSVPSWADDGKSIVAVVKVGREVSISLLNVTDPEQAQVTRVLWRKGDGLAVSPFYPVYHEASGRCVFVGRNENREEALYAFVPGQTKPQRVEPVGYSGKIASLSLSADGRYVLFCSQTTPRPEASPAPVTR